MVFRIVFSKNFHCHTEFPASMVRELKRKHDRGCNLFCVLTALSHWNAGNAIYGIDSHFIHIRHVNRRLAAILELHIDSILIKNSAFGACLVRKFNCPIRRRDKIVSKEASLTWAAFQSLDLSAFRNAITPFLERTDSIAFHICTNRVVGCVCVFLFT